MTLRQTIYVLLAIGLVIATCCGLVYSAILNWDFPDPSEGPLLIAQALVQTVAAEPLRPTLVNTPDMYLGIEGCKDFLHPFMVRNNNQYTISVFAVYGDWGTPIPSPTGSDEVLIDVLFPDGGRVTLQYYAGTLNMCHQLGDR